MNEEEIPSISVRQRAAAINRTLKEEQSQSQNPLNKRGSEYTTKGRAPWRSVGVNANSTLPLRRPILPSRTRPNNNNLDTTVSQQKMNHSHNDIINTKRTNDIHNKISYKPTSTGMNTTNTKLQQRRGTFMSSTVTPITKTLTTQTSPKLGKRPLSTLKDEHPPFNKYQKIPIINEHKLSRTSSLYHHTSAAATRSTFKERERRSPSISSHSSVLSTTNYPIHYDDKVANLYAQYMQWELITLDANESTDRRKIEEENRLWGMYDILWELGQNHEKDDPTIIKMSDRLKEFSSIYEQFQDVIQGGAGTLKLSDGFIQNLLNIIKDLRLNARDLLNKNGRIETNLDELETDMRALEECHRIITKVAQVEAENESLSAIL